MSGYLIYIGFVFALYFVATAVVWRHHEQLRILNFGVCASFGFGAYAAIIATQHGAHTIVAAIVAVIVGAVLQLSFAAAWLWVSRLAFMFVSLLGLLIARNVPVVVSDPTQPVGTLQNLTNGVIGLSAAPLSSTNWPDIAAAAATLLVAAVALALTARPSISRPLATRAYGDDAAAAELMGVPRSSVITNFFVVGGALGLCGWLYSITTGYVEPGVFSLAFILKVIVAYSVAQAMGAWSLPLGVAVVVLLPELIRQSWLGPAGAHWEAVVFGIIAALLLLTNNRRERRAA